jgi:hypothetical protein
MSFDPDLQVVPDVDGDLLQVLASDIHLQVAEPIHLQHLGVQMIVMHPGLGDVETDQVTGVHRRAELRRRDAGRDVRRRRGEDIAALEGARHRCQEEAPVRDLERPADPARKLCGRDQQTVVRPDEGLTAPGFDGNGAAARSHPRVDDR